MALQIGKKIFSVTIDTLRSLQLRADGTRQFIDPDFRKFRGNFDDVPGGNIVRRLCFATISKRMPHEQIKRAILERGMGIADVDDQIALAEDHPEEQVTAPIVQLASTARREKVADLFWIIDVSILDVENGRNVITTGECTDNREWEPRFKGKPYRFLVRLPEGK